MLLACVATIAVLGGAWLWVRDSSLVAVERVSVVGATGPDASNIRHALIAAGRTMTTLDLHMNALQTAVAPFAVVKRLQVSTHFPHAIRIRVIEEAAVGAVQFDGQTVAVARDGRLLRDAIASSLPLISLRVPPGGRRLTDATALRAVALLAAAPSRVLADISQVATVAAHGLVAQVRGGPAIYFGDLTSLQAKWDAALAVLGDQGSAGAAYIDVTDPQHPAAGAGPAMGTSSAAQVPADTTAASSTSQAAAGASAGASAASDTTAPSSSSGASASPTAPTATGA